MLNDFKKAKESYEIAARINSVMYHSKYSIAQLNLIYGEFEEAEKDFEECIAEEEIEAGSYYYLSRIAIIKGKLEKAINYANLAVELDNENYQKIMDDNLFITIKNKIKKPDNIDKNIVINITSKEQKTFKHLEKTCKLVGKLNNNDIQMVENVSKIKEKTNNDREKDVN